ncbi:electron transport complex protein RnfG [Alloalcanivorax xenomutans]|uniref:electron transport complex subunit RsxG n=1 Tax=Alloalcanivorax xenomutans TaxID=1094342 RepID=UPI000BD32D4F|nr:electron transport complex subunit RsxG [Alloalcanivorax xenomutans]SOC07259.1 electron transport complex protein RnfG [Alloalcanivorax xenomutans]
MIGQAITRNAVILGLFAIGTAATLALTNQATRQRVECNRQAALADALAQVMPPARHDNPLLDDSITVTDPLLGHGEHHIYRARLGGEASGAVLEAVAPDGYGGDIRLIVGVDRDGTVLGVRVVPPHNETPGLGDNIEIRKSDWILGFNGTSLEQPSASGWAVKKDGGRFDSFTGATITPRAVVSAVHGALRYYQAHGDEVFKAPAQAQTTESCDG